MNGGFIIEILLNNQYGLLNFQTQLLQPVQLPRLIT
ncbi:hypothetical protein CCP4SC76_2010005 [Gammaproteobacteria bacterium]